MFGGATPSIVGSRVHRQSESGGLVPLIESSASTLQFGIEGIDADGEENKLRWGVTVMVATLGSSPSHHLSGITLIPPFIWKSLGGNQRNLSYKSFRHDLHKI